MRNRSTVPIALAGAMLLTFMALSPSMAQKGPGDPEAPITLRLLVQDGQGRQSEAVVNDLVALASRLSGGLITIVPTFEGGDVASATMAGDTDLGIVPSRDWDSVGVTSLDVLEAPFLIDNDALALAVATSDIADRAMDGLASVGVRGLAMWPEDLRHLFALSPSGADFSTPDGLGDADVLVVAGQPGHDLITQLGGRIYDEGVSSGDLVGDRWADAEGGTLEGMVTGLWGAGLPTDEATVAGDLVVYSKYQMLVANAAVLDGLTDGQRESLQQIVDALREAAPGRHFTEADLALERCKAGGTVVALGADAIESFRAAAQPLTDRLVADPVTGPLMADVVALKATTPASPGAGTCEPASAEPSPSAVAGLIGDRLPPAGTYRVDMVTDELVALGADRAFAGDNAGTWTWVIAGDRWSLEREARGDHCTGSLAVAVDIVTVSDDPGGSCSMGGHFRWRSHGDGLQFWYTDGQGGPMDARTLQIMNELVWSHIVDAPASVAPSATGFIGDRLPPAGAYRIDYSMEDALAAGASRDYAGANTGIWTWTFDGGTWTAEHRGEACNGTTEIRDGTVAFVTLASNGCNQDYLVRWRDDGDGLTFQLAGFSNLTTPTESQLVNERTFIERKWLRLP